MRSLRDGAGRSAGRASPTRCVDSSRVRASSAWSSSICPVALPSRSAKSAIQDPLTVPACERRRLSSARSVSTVQVGHPQPRESLSPVRMPASSTIASATVGQSR